MLAAVKEGDAKKVSELMRQDPGFKVNMDLGNGWALLHEACGGNGGSAMIPLLLAHPDIDVNPRDMDGWTPFFRACLNGYASCVREMLKDSRVNVNEPDNDGYTPLYWAAHDAPLDIIKWWIASGREMDLRNQGMSTRRMPLGRQRREAGQKWWPCWRDSRRIQWKPGML